MCNINIRVAIHILTQVLSTQVARDARIQVNPIATTTASGIRDFTKMNPPTFFGSNVEEVPQGYIDELFKVLYVMGMASLEKAELAAYRLKDVSQVWYEQWKDETLAEQIEEQKIKQVCSEMKRTRAEDRNSFKSRFEVQDKSTLKKRFPNQRRSTFPSINQGKGSTPKAKDKKVSGLYVEKSSCAKCGRKHEGKCLVGTGNFYGYGKSGHMNRIVFL
nr:uncharacterized protein LOC101251380 [Solanum lycopersicum]